MALTSSPAGAGSAGTAEEDTAGDEIFVFGTVGVAAEAPAVVAAEAPGAVAAEAPDVVDAGVAVGSERSVVESETMVAGAVTAAADTGGPGTGQPDSDVVTAGDDTVVTGTDRVGAGTSTGDETDWATTISPMK